MPGSWLVQAKTPIPHAPILDRVSRAEQEEEAMSIPQTSENGDYLLAGQVSELERLQLQSRVWEPSGRRLLQEIGDGRGGRALDVGCGVLGWLDRKSRLWSASELADMKWL